MKCPRCSSTVPPNPDPLGFLMCPGCGARLRTRAAVAPGATGAPTPGSASAPAFNPDSTLPPGMMATVPRPVAAPPPTPLPRPPAPTPPPARPAPVAPPVTVAPPPPVAAPPPAAPSPAATPLPAGLDAVLAELKALRRGQEEILSLLRSASRGTASGDLGMMDAPDQPPPPAPSPSPGPVRARRRKTVLLVDDDVETCDAATRALQQAEVPTRVARDGSAAIAAIAAEKPDVIAMELDIGGSMAGKDVINMIKATMEWVDIPIVLFTRLPVENQKEARTEHGADDFVLKGPDGDTELVKRVIALFRRG